MDTIKKQTKQIKIQECLAILDINNDSSVVIPQIKLKRVFGRKHFRVITSLHDMSVATAVNSSNI
jgi:hypothetical protein